MELSNELHSRLSYHSLTTLLPSSLYLRFLIQSDRFHSEVDDLSDDQDADIIFSPSSLPHNAILDESAEYYDDECPMLDSSLDYLSDEEIEEIDE